MPKRSDLARIGAQTVSITHAGEYQSPSGRTVSLRDAIDRAVRNSTLITPADHRALRARADALIAARPGPTTFAVEDQTTLAAARPLVDRFGPDRVAALNFASAKNPGGGFLGGARAQEEYLARASALYPCLLAQPAYYAANRRAPDALYTDHMICSPCVPVFRDDDMQLLEQPWQVSIITAPAPNAGALTSRGQAFAAIETTFRRRIDQLLACAAAHDFSALVLGAWGCGAFRNDPTTVARCFAETLLPPGPFANAFTHVTFAILDTHGTNLAPFEREFTARRE